MKPILCTLAAAVLLSACKPGLCGPTAEARREARSKARRWPEVHGAELGESMSKLEKAVAANAKGAKNEGNFLFLAHSASQVREHAAQMELPSKGGDAARFLVQNFDQSRSHLNTALEEASRVCGD
jgi:hypothetical protein